jgi:uncharacterized membrane protein
MVQFFLISLMVILNVLAYSSLPSLVPTHWNIVGQIDGYMPKNIGIWIIPLLSIGLIFLFKYIPSFDPKKNKYKLFEKEWNTVQMTILSFLTYIHFITIYFAYNPTGNFLKLFFLGFGIFFILLGNYMSKIRQNYFVGVRTPWALNDEDNWNKTQRYASWCFVTAGIIVLIEAFVLWLPAVIIFSSILLAALLPTVYSFLLFKKKESLMKWIYIGILGIVLIIFSAKGLSGEDDWICKNGQWVKHGNPSAQMPNQKCDQAQY